MRRPIGIGIATALLAGAAVVAGTGNTAHASAIVVTTTGDVSGNDGLCSLREAIVSANTDVASGAAEGECAAGGEEDVITLTNGATYIVTAPLLPALSGSITLVGNDSTIESGVPLRVLQVDADSTVELSDVTLTHLFSTSGVTGRGLYNRGDTTLRNVTITDNSEIGQGGGIFNGDDVGGQPVSLTIIDSTVSQNSNVDSPDDRSGGGIRNHANATLLIRGSTISDNSTHDSGGGISSIGTSVTVNDGSVISGNTADGQGGGISLLEGMLTVTDSTISGNESTVSGGGIMARRLATLERVEISGNSAVVGGGIHSTEELELRDATVTGNSAGNDGGGLHLGGEATVTDAVIADNDAGDDGGGVYAVVSTGTIQRGTVSGNTAGGNGGGIVSLGTNQLTQLAVTGNTAGNWGGGIRAGRETIISRSTISGNAAAAGGGAYIGYMDTMANTTVSGNIAEEYGGGIAAELDATLSFVTVTNNSAPVGAGMSSVADDFGFNTVTASIIAGNKGPGADASLRITHNSPVDTFKSGGYNVIGSVGELVATFDEPGDVIGVTDPGLETLGDYGGPNRTHRPLPTSLAVSRVSSNVEGSGDVDQRGAPRSQFLRTAGAHECLCLPPVVSDRPQRIADSRDEPTIDDLFHNTGPRAGGTVWEIDVYPRRFAIGGVPKGAVLNVTALNAAAPGFATVYPCSDEVPNASSLNYQPGTVEPNEVIAKLSSQGTVCVFTLTTVDIIIDLVGWVPEISGYTPLPPSRFADSRAEDTFDGAFRDTGIRQGGSVWEIDVAGRGDVLPAIGEVAVNLTVTGATGPGFATVYPCTDEVPNASSLNYDVGITRPNELVTKLSPDGTLCVFVLTDVHIIVDVVGQSDSRSYVGTEPARLADTRVEDTVDGLFRATGIRPGDSTWEIQVSGRGGIPADAVRSAMLNVTVTGGTAPGFVTIYGCGSAPRPDTSSVNYVVGTTRPNEVLTSVSLDGTICAYTSADVHIIVDVVGYIATRERYVS